MSLYYIKRAQRTEAGFKVEMTIVPLTSLDFNEEQF
jgi:hypothetical protein